MGLSIDQIVTEETAAVQAEINQRIVGRLQSESQTITDQVNALTSELSDIDAKIKALTPEVESPSEDASEQAETGQANGEVPVNQG